MDTPIRIMCKIDHSVYGSRCAIVRQNEDGEFPIPEYLKGLRKIPSKQALLAHRKRACNLYLGTYQKDNK